MPKVNVNGVNIYYEISGFGGGEPLVFISGHNMCAGLLYKHIPVFAQEYRVIAPDNRGAGQSDAPNMPYTFKMMTDDIAAVMTDAGVNAAHIIGYAMGARLAQEFALRFPDRVNSLILAATGCGGPDTVPADEETRNRMAYLESLLPKYRMRGFLDLVFSRSFIERNPVLIAQMVEIMAAGCGPPHGQLRQAHASMSYDNYDRLPDIMAPTMVIAGGADKLNPFENARALAEIISWAELVKLENMGHFFMWEAFSESNRIMLEFLRARRVKSI